MISSESIGLLFRATGDTSDAKKKFADLKDSISKDVKKIESDVESSSKSGGGFSKITGEVEVLSSTVAELSGGLAIAGAAIAVFAAGAVAVVTVAAAIGKELFDLANSASDFGSQIQDVAEKTGLATDVLQGLRYAAGQGGASFEEVSNSFSKFARLLDSASSGNEKAKKTLEDLGVTSTDLNTALSQAYQTILKYPEGTKQMAATMSAFGKSSSDLLPTLKSFSGDLEKLKKEAKDSGLVLSDSSIKAADEMGDAYAKASLQVKTLTAEFALQYAPVITNAIKEVSKFLSENKDAFAYWGKAVRDILKETASTIQPIFKEIYDYLKVKDKLGEDSFLTKIAKSFNNIATLGFGDFIERFRELRAEQDKFTEGSVKASAVLDVFDDSAKKLEALKEIVKDLTTQITFFGDESEVAKVKQKLLSEGITDFNSGLAKSAIELAKTIDALKKIKKEQDDYNDKVKKAQEYMKNLREETDFKINFPKPTELDTFNEWVRKSADGLRGLQKEVNLTREKIQDLLFNKTVEERDTKINTFSDAVKKNLSDLSVKTDDFAAKYKQLVIELVKPLNLDKALGTAAMSPEKFAGNIVTRFENLKTDLAKVPEDIDLLISRGIIGSDKRAAAIKTASQDVVKEFQQRFKGFLETFKQKAGDKEAGIFAVSKDDLENVQKFIDLWDILAGSMENAKNSAQSMRGEIGELIKSASDNDESKGERHAGFFDFFTKGIGQYLEGVATVKDANGDLHFSFEKTFETIKDLGLQAFEQLTQGFGQMVSNWVLYGNTGGQTLRKLAASVLSNLAGIATQYALMCLAAAAFATTGFGAAILGGSPHQFLLAAGAFGLLAVGAAIAGRAIAGDSFKQDKAQNAFNNQTDKATGQKRDGGKVYSSYGDDASVINIGRNAPAETKPQEIHLKLSLDSHGVLDVVHDDVQRNGRTRTLILDVAGS